MFSLLCLFFFLIDIGNTGGEPNPHCKYDLFIAFFYIVSFEVD